MAGKTKPGIPVKGINIKLKMINDLIDVTGSAKDSWNPSEISDDMKAIAYIHDLADTWNPAQLNEALKYLGFATIDSWNPAIIEETKNKLVKYFLPTDASGNPIELDLKGVLPYEVTALTITLLPIQSGTGYPSPSNVRPITGRDSVTLTVNGDDIETTFENTVYSGTLDLITGKLTIDKEIIDFADITWSYFTSGANPVFTGLISNCKEYERSEIINSLCSCYKLNKYSNNRSYFTNNLTNEEYSFIEIYKTVIVRDDSYTDADEFKTARTGQKIIYELATPIEVTLTPEEITLINGENTLSTDGDTINITYKANLNS